jgi:hypothetical protein
MIVSSMTKNIHDDVANDLTKYMSGRYVGRVVR